jgi:hypothetical protein
MRDKRIGKPEEERAASSSTQSASGLGGGTPEGRPAEGRGEPPTDQEPSREDQLRQERDRELERRAPTGQADNSADDGAVRTDF